MANCLYKKVLSDKTEIWMSLYVDDCIMGGGTEEQRTVEIDKIFARFPGKMIEPVQVKEDGTLHIRYQRHRG